MDDNMIITHYDNEERYRRLEQDHAMVAWEPINERANIKFVTNIAREYNLLYTPHPMCVRREFFNVIAGVGEVGEKKDLKRIDVYLRRTGENPLESKLIVSVDETLGEEWTKELDEKIESIRLLQGVIPVEQESELLEHLRVA